MADCDIVIVLDDSGPRTGGAPISGTIVVKVNKSLDCKGLVASTSWSTHGRGNVETATVAEETLFTGNWQMGQEYRYAFRLATAVWPPTYYGSYLNVGHYVNARAKLSWRTDPKAMVEFPVVATDAPEDLAPTKAAEKSSLIGWIIGVVLLAVLLPFLGMLALILVPIVALGGGIYWFFKVFLPQQIVGNAKVAVAATRVRAGDVLKATLSFTPRRASTINGVEWAVTCIEECSSGSGSNRQTHTNKLVDHTERAVEQLELKVGQAYSFDLEYPIPENAPPSLKFSDNKVAWTVVGRIDIPKWPDWIKTTDIVVVPNAKATVPVRSYFEGLDEDEDEDEDLSDAVLVPQNMTSETLKSQDNASESNADDAWFRQVVQQLLQVQHDPEKLATVVEAVEDYVFPIDAMLESPCNAPRTSDAFDFDHLEDATWWNVFHAKHNMTASLAWITPYTQLRAGEVWKGHAVIVGFDSSANRILMEVTSAAG